MKWDYSHKDSSSGDTIREAYFQDEKEAHTLRDIGGRYMVLERYDRHIEASASRGAGRCWFVTVGDQTKPDYAYTKDQAIDIMLGKEQS